MNRTTFAVLLLAGLPLAPAAGAADEKVDLAAPGPDARGIPQGILRLPPQTHPAEASAAAHEAGTPGTLVLVFVFLAVFILYYFTNWKVLSMIWKMG